MKIKKYTFGKFIKDVIMCTLTLGLWLIWVFIREMRRIKSNAKIQAEMNELNTLRKQNDARYEDLLSKELKEELKK